MSLEANPNRQWRLRQLAPAELGAPQALAPQHGLQEVRGPSTARFTSAHPQGCILYVLDHPEGKATPLRFSEIRMGDPVGRSTICTPENLILPRFQG